MTPQLFQPATSVLLNVVRNRAAVAVVVRQFTIAKRVALDLAVNRRAMTAKPISLTGTFAATR
ncbi:hypothetical protein ASC97_23905 [Rhizobium sp. Root1203]|nr:hypothetical protein ASC97_23905 [Rhizobium sp. Root1203]